ncbi:MAG: FtsB family cell division protein [Methylocystaceae bacterium]
MNKKPSSRRWLWLLLAFFLVINLPSIKNMWTLHQQLGDLQRQESMIKKQNKALESQVKLLKTDSEVEKIAREQLGLIKPGEHLLVPVQK